MSRTDSTPASGARGRGPSSWLAPLLAFLSIAFGALHFVRLHSARNMRLLALRVLAGALAPVWAAFGLIGGLAGAQEQRSLTATAGLAGLLASAYYMRRVAAVTPPAPSKARRLPRSKPQVTRDLVFRTTTIPPGCGDGERQVYFDIWEPVPRAPRSGTGIVYLHGSGWYLGDKAQLTDPMLGGWAGQGHVVMDVAYRMCPETDLRGMMSDAWAAVDWLKTHAERYGINPDKVILSGTSAGGHIALLAAFTADQASLLPAELTGHDVTVGGVIAMSAPVDMPAMLEYHKDLVDTAHPEPGVAYDPLVDPDPLIPPGPGGTRSERMRWQRAQNRRIAGLLRDLLGGGPDEAPEMFEFASVKSHVRPGLPPTLLIQGGQDMLVPVEPTRELYWQLQTTGVRAEYLELPLTDHAFEIALPGISPPARAAGAAISRFLANL